jgi:hypothetical protein
MPVTTSAGAKVYIGPVTTAEDETALAALTYVLVGKVESIGEIGPQAQDVTFIPLDGTDVQHLKGATDNGATTVTCGRLPLDPGQLALKAASKTKFEYALKIVLADASDANDTDTVIYVRGPVMSGRLNVGGGNDVTKTTYAVGNNVFHEVTSEAVS